MKLKKIFRTAWEGLMLNKVRSFLTTLGVIIGVASVIVMLAVSAGAEASIAEQINALGANLIIVSPMRGTPGAAKTLLLEDATAIAEHAERVICVKDGLILSDGRGGSNPCLGSHK